MCLIGHLGQSAPVWGYRFVGKLKAQFRASERLPFINDDCLPCWLRAAPNGAVDFFFHVFYKWVAPMAHGKMRTHSSTIGRILKKSEAEVSPAGGDPIAIGLEGA